MRFQFGVIMMKNKAIFLALLMLSGTATADLTGAGDAAAYKQLVILVENTRQQLEELRKNLSVAENMRDMQRNELVQELTTAGEAFGQMFNDLRAMERELEAWKDDPYGTNQIENDITRLSSNLAIADGREGFDQGASYASILRSLNQLKWLGKVQAENEKKVAEGISEKDSEKLGNSALVSINRLLLEQEMARQRQDVISQEIFMGTLKNVNYGQMGLMGGE